MANTPFTWGAGGQKITSPEAAARQRKIAEALIAQSATPADNWASGLGDVAAALSGTVLQGRADEAELAGRERAGGLFADLAVNSDPNSIIAALTSPDSAWASPAQTSIASALLNSGLERQDPMYQLQLEQAQMQTEAMRNPPPQMFNPDAPTSYQEYQLGQVDPAYGATLGDDGSLVTVNTGTNNDFFSGLGNAEGEIFSGFLTGGQTAARNLGQIQTLEGLLANSPTGMDGAATQLAGEFGIDLGGASGVQAAQALINKMVPEQRQPGSGPMSDRDLEIFKASLPRIINQPGGNELIIDTLKAINAYDMELARITQEGLAQAEQSADPQERARIKANMRAQINSLQNPVTPFRERVGTTPTGHQALPPGVTIRRLD